MAQVFSNAHVDVVIDGSHRVVGFADEDRPFEFSGGEELFEISRSEVDGGLYAMSRAGSILGGQFYLRLQPNSPSAAWLIQRKHEIKRAIRQGQEIRSFEITVKDSVQGRSSTLEGCLLQQCPDQVESGQTFEVMFEAEFIESNNAGAVFRAPFDNGAPVAAGAG